MRPRIDLTPEQIIDCFLTLGLSLDASKKDVKNAYQRLIHHLHSDKATGKNEKFSKINAAYAALTGMNSKQLKHAQQLLLKDINEEIDCKTVKEYIEKKLSNRLDLYDANFDIDPSLDLDTPATFYLYTPITPCYSSVSPFLLEPEDYITLTTEACKQRYCKVSSTKDGALNVHGVYRGSPTIYPNQDFEDYMRFQSGFRKIDLA